ncbi:MAG: protein-L-isoaspartate(D-aspartate) O-methyltransferase [Acidobacteria bacterium]|nr:protein-L-isoaspartate(D-aspartate) O-methyltransferase [Acidobacteriota bacterium]
MTRLDTTTSARSEMVSTQIAGRGITSGVVLRAMSAVPRHLFVPETQRAHAYDDSPLPLGGGQTISQPYIVAFMTEAVLQGPGMKILEIGTGSGYQSAILAETGADLFTIEIVPALAEEARGRLDALGYGRVRSRTGDGYRGWPEEAPFDGILVTAAPDHVPPALLDQLGEGGRLVIPLGATDQSLWLFTRRGGRLVNDVLLPVRFVPMTGEARWS